MEPLHNLESICTSTIRKTLYSTLEKGLNAKKFLFSCYVPEPVNEAHTVLKQASSSSLTHCIKFNQHSRSTQLHKHSRHEVCVCMCETTYSVNSFKGTSDSVAICTRIKFNIKIHTTNSHKINFTMSIFNQFFLVEFFSTFPIGKNFKQDLL